MATQQSLFSPAELAYLHRTLSLRPPIRPDGRTPTQFRPLTAETGVLPGTNGSARVHFADGTEAIVGVKAEIEKTAGGEEDQGEEDRTRGDWLELAVEIPGQRDDDASTVFLAEMLREALLADKEFAKKLRINRRFHWRLYLDVCGHLRIALLFATRLILTIFIGSANITSAVIPSPPSLTHNPPCSPGHAPPAPQVGG